MKQRPPARLGLGMTTRIRSNEEGDLTLLRELLEEEVQDGVLLAASHDEQGNVVLRRLKRLV